MQLEVHVLRRHTVKRATHATYLEETEWWLALGDALRGVVEVQVAEHGLAGGMCLLEATGQSRDST